MIYFGGKNKILDIYLNKNFLPFFSKVPLLRIQDFGLIQKSLTDLGSQAELGV